MNLPHIGNRYEVKSRLGTGGMATVYLAKDVRLLREVAIKVVDVESVGEKGLFFFHREARATAALRHLNIVQVYDYSGSEESPAYLVMELIDGTTLESLIKKYARVPEQALAAILWALASALSHAHDKGVIHRDVKPGNVMVENSGRVLLTDFGIAKAYRDPSRLGATVVGKQTGLHGTPSFMAPEQILDREVGPSADIFALGSLAYSMAVGRPPFRSGKDPVEVLRRIIDVEYVPAAELSGGIDPDLEQVISSCLQKQTSIRPTAAQVVERCEEWLRARGVLSPEKCILAFIEGRGGELTKIDLKLQTDQLDEVSSTEPEFGADSPGVEQTVTDVATDPLEVERTVTDIDTDAPVRGGRVVPGTTERHPILAESSERLASSFRFPRRSVLLGFGILILVSALVATWAARRQGRSTVTGGLRPAVVLPSSPPLSSGESEPVLPVIEEPAPRHQDDRAEPSPDKEPVAPTVPTKSPVRRLPEGKVRAREERSRKKPAVQGVGVIELTVRPWATVSLDGKERGNTPVVRLITVPVGKHTVTVTHPTLGKRQRTFAVRKGEHKMISFDLRP